MSGLGSDWTNVIIPGTDTTSASDTKVTNQKSGTQHADQSECSTYKPSSHQLSQRHKGDHSEIGTQHADQ